ncbi:MAG: dTMP kinase [Verrucomicrobiota bacterium]
MTGWFITFEGGEGVGKSTQIQLLAERLRGLGRRVCVLREPGGTPIGEEIRHTLKHSDANHAMTPEAELLLMNASRAQLVRERIRPALAAGEIVLCDRFYDSTLAYQGYGRELDLKRVRQAIDIAVDGTHPDLTLLLVVPAEVAGQRMEQRRGAAPAVRDRLEESGREFFRRVDAGYRALAAAEPGRFRIVEASGDVTVVSEAIWRHVAPILPTGS